MKQPIRWTMREPGYGRCPQVCRDAEGLVWVAWISWTDKGECIRVSRRERDGQWSQPVVCSDFRPLITGLSIAPWQDGLLMAWIDGSDPDRDGLKLKIIAPDSGSDERLIMPWRRGPAHPCVDSDGSHCALAWSVRRVGGRHVVACFGEPRSGFEKIVEVSSGAGRHVRPSVACKGGRSVIAWEASAHGFFSILARTAIDGGCESETIELESSPKGILALPAVRAAMDGGTWVAWQSDLDPKTGPALVRWIEVAHLGDDGLVRRPSASMPGVNRQGKGEDQGFESPSLAVLKDGGLVLVGRGSQSVRRQVLGSAGWSDNTRIDDEGWKCRGRRFTVCPADEGFFTAGREQDGIAVRYLPVGEADSQQTVKFKLGRARTQRQLEKTLSLPPEHQHAVAGNRVLFGDIHQHTSASDGTGTAEETYHRARYRYLDEIVAIADHESFLGKRTTPGDWSETCRIADEFYQPGAFVTLHAFEWTGKMHPGPGHKVVYLPPEGGPVLSREQAATNSPKGLLAECGKLGALAFPHHVGWTGADMDNHDPEIQTCFEIVSCHGAYERSGVGPIGTRGDDKEGQFLGDALDKGLRFGLVGGSDGHGLNWHHGVCRVQDSHRSGLTGVFSQEVSREGVLEALRKRRCYATSGAKIGLWFEIDGRPMGEELSIGWPVPFRVVVEATGPIESLALVTNSGQELKLDASGRRADVRGTLQPPAEGWCYYFVRVVQTDGEVAWSSPIWMDAPDSA